MSIYWIELPMAGRLAIMARPRAGDWLDDEISAWRTAGIKVVVSLLEREEIAELGLQREPSLCLAQGIEFISFPIPDRGVPSSPREVTTLVRNAAAWIAEGKAVAVHCRAGIGRASLIAACALACRGVHPDLGFDLIAKARGVAVPDTVTQRDWVVAFGTGLQS